MYTWNPAIGLRAEDDQLTFVHETHVERLHCGKLGLNGRRLMATFQCGPYNERDSGAICPYPDTRVDLFESLVHRGLLVDISRRDHGDRSMGYFAAFSSTPSECLRRLEVAKVGLLGLGGTGSVVLQNLVGSGVRKFVLFDADVVAPHNLNRQFIYQASDIGKKKICAASAYVLDRIIDPEIQLVDKWIESATDISSNASGIDILFCCIDTPVGAIDQILSDYRRNTGVATIQADVGIRYGSVGPLRVDDSRLPRSKNAKSMNYGSTVPTRWSFGPTNMLIGAMLAKDWIEWLAGLAPSELCGEKRIVCFAQ